MPRQPVLDPDYLLKLQDYYAKHRLFPSYLAIAKIVGLKSTGSVSALLDRLKAERYLETENRRLRPGARFFERPLMQSRVAAGLPAMAVDGPPEGLGIDAYLIEFPSRTFLLNVKGESMIGVGIMPDDTVVVERAHTASEGKIVVALVDDGATIKTLVRENRKFVLRPENKAFPVLRPDPLEIIGIVTGIFRNYR